MENNRAQYQSDMSWEGRLESAAQQTVDLVLEFCSVCVLRLMEVR